MAISLAPSDYIAGISVVMVAVQFFKAQTISRENSALISRVSVLESQIRSTDNTALGARVSVLESQHQGHGEQIGELRSDVSKMGVQLNELFRQVVGVQEKLANNSIMFADKFDRILSKLEDRR